MIRIKKKYWKWKKGDKPSVTVSKAHELVGMGVAEFIGDPKDYSLEATEEGIKQTKNKNG